MFILVLCAILASALVIFLSYKGVDAPAKVGFNNPTFTDLNQQAQAGLTTVLDYGGILIGLGGVLIFIFYYARFSQWAEPPKMRLRQKPPRHFTSGSRYVLHATLYAMVFVALYALLLYVPGILNSTKVLASADATGFLAELAQRLDEPGAAIPYAVILITMILPALFGKQERAFRKEIQSLAYIPAEAQALVRRLVGTPSSFAPEPETIRTLLKGQRDQILKLRDFDSDKSDLTALYTRIAYHLDCLKHLSVKRNFSLIELRYKEDIDALKAEYQRLGIELAEIRDLAIERARALLAENDRSFLDPDTDDLAPHDRDALWLASDLSILEKKDRELNQRSGELRRKFEDLIEQLYEIMVGLVLALERFPHERRERFRVLGLDVVQWNPVIMSRSDILQLGATIFLALLVPTVAYKLAVDEWSNVAAAVKDSYYVPATIGLAFSWIVTGLAMHLSAVVIGLVTKRWIANKRINTIRRREERPKRQFEDYFDAATLAFAVNIFILLVFSRLHPDPRGQLSATWFWAFVPGLTAAATVWHLDSFAIGRLSPWRGLAFQGIATSLLSIFMAWVTKEANGLKLDEFAVFCVYAGVVTFLIGGGIGFWFPRLYARQMRLYGERPEMRRAQRFMKRIDGTWTAEGASSEVHTLDISRVGCRLGLAIAQSEGTVGRLRLGDKLECFARVIRKEEETTGLEFLPEEGWRRLEQDLYEAA